MRKITFVLMLLALTVSQSAMGEVIYANRSMPARDINSLYTDEIILDNVIYQLLPDGQATAVSHPLGVELKELNIPEHFTFGATEYTVTGIGDWAFQDCKSLTSVSIPESVTNMGEAVFMGCTGLPVIDNIRYADKYLVRVADSTLSKYHIQEGTKWIGEEAFFGCTNLKSIKIPKSVIDVGNAAFEYCDKLPVIGKVRYADTYLVGVTDRNQKTYKIRKGTKWMDSRAFENCSEMVSLKLPESMVSIGGFWGCTSLKEINIPKGVKSINPYRFQSCPFPEVDGILYIDSYLVEVKDKNRTEYTVREGTRWIGRSAFTGCNVMKSVSLPASLETIEANAFNGCSSLESISIPEGVTRIEGNTFSWCSNLKDVSIPQSVNFIQHQAFWGCFNLSVIDGIRYAGDYLAGVTDTTRTEYRIRKGTRWIGYNAFEGCSRMTSIDIPEGVIDIQHGAFEGCWRLESLTLPQSLRSIAEYSFYGCAGLKSLTIPDGVTAIPMHCFHYCMGLETVKLPKDLRFFGGSAFENCVNLKSINVPEKDMYYGWNAFYNCRKLPSTDGLIYFSDILVGVADTVRTHFTIREGTKKIAGGAFYGSKIKSLSIPQSVSYIGKFAFNLCDQLESITIPEKVTEILEYTFGYCEKLRKVNFLGHIQTIKVAAFCECPMLEPLELPDDTWVDEDAYKENTYI